MSRTVRDRTTGASAPTLGVQVRTARVGSRTRQPAHSTLGVGARTTEVGTTALAVAPADLVRLNGEERSLAEVLAIYERSLDARAAVASLKQQLTVAMGNRLQAEAERQGTDKALRARVVSRFGEGSEQAPAFGFAPHVRPMVEVATKARALALAQATRKARHTLGRRQRARIKGTLPPDAPSGTNEGG